ITVQEIGPITTVVPTGSTSM
nr:immunoglobulin heavy chain junction region [Mus musculus]